MPDDGDSPFPDIPAPLLPPAAMARETVTAQKTSSAASLSPRVFISHTLADNDFGYPLVDRLRAALGSVDAVYYDSRGVTPDGIGWEGGVHPAEYWEMDVFRQLHERSVFVVLLSAESLTAPWVQDEILLAWKQKNERGRTVPKVIVPVIVPSAIDLRLSEPLDLIQTVSFVERPGWTYEQAFQALLVAIRSPQTRLWPGEAEPPFELEELPRPERFIGRHADLTWVLDRLKPGAMAGVTALRGLGGIGKTALAAEVVQRAFEEARFPSGIAVQRCDDMRDPIEVLKRLLASFDPERRQPETSDLKGLAEVARKLLRGRRILVVLDNVEPALDIAAVLQRLTPTGVAILLTAREQLPIAHKDTIDLALLSDAAALDLFVEWYGRPNTAALTREELASARKIITALGNHTLAVKLAGAQAADLDRPLAQFADEIEKHPLNIQGQGANAALALRDTLSRSVNALPAGGELGDVRRLFAALATFVAPARDAEDSDRVTLIPSLEFGRRAAAAVGEALKLPEPNRAVDLLLRRALLDKYTDETLPEGTDRERLRFHSLLREVAAELLDDTTRDAASLAIAAFYADHISRLFADYVADGNVLNKTLATDAGNIAGTLEWVHECSPDSDRDALVAHICEGMRNFWRDRWRTLDSLRYLPWGIKAARTIASQLRDESRIQRAANIAVYYGDVLMNIGRLSEAEQTFRADLDQRRQRGDRQGESAALSRLGKIAQARGRLEEAEGCFKQALLIDHQVQDNSSTGADLSHLGQIALSRGRLAEAADYFQQGLAIARELQNRQEEGTQTAWLAEVAFDRGQLDEAERLWRCALDIRDEVQDILGTGRDLFNLGKVAHVRGRLADAAGYFQQSLAIVREARDRRDEGGVLSSLGQIALARGQLAEATGYLQQSLTIAREVQNRQGEGVVFYILGVIARITDKLDEAERYFRECLTLMRDVQDAKNEGAISQILGEFLIVHRGNRDEGCALISSAVRIFHQIGVPDEQEARELAQRLGCNVEG